MTNEETTRYIPEDALLDFIQANAVEPEPQEDEGWALQLDQNDRRLRLTLTWNGEKYASAGSWLKGDSDLDFVQAISYAAHMLYKLCEQREMDD